MMRTAVMGVAVGLAIVGWGQPAKRAEAQYTGPRFQQCFDRCMTRCHLPKGYHYCRDDCRSYCGRYRRPYGG